MNILIIFSWVGGNSIRKTQLSAKTGISNNQGDFDVIYFSFAVRQF